MIFSMGASHEIDLSVHILFNNRQRIAGSN